MIFEEIDATQELERRARAAASDAATISQNYVAARVVGALIL